MPNMKLQVSRQNMTLVLQGMVSDSTELRKEIIYRLTPNQLKLLDEVESNIRIIKSWQQ